MNVREPAMCTAAEKQSVAWDTANVPTLHTNGLSASKGDTVRWLKPMSRPYLQQGRGQHIRV